MYDGGYLFIYLMMFVAIAEYSLEKKMTPRKIDNVIRTTVLSTAKSDIKNICDADACFDIILSNNEDSTIAKIHLLSASYNRLGKWSNNLYQRISLNDTLAGNIIDNAKSEGDLLRALTEIDIKQLKFSAWTRDSPIITKLMALLPETSTAPYKGGGIVIKINKKRKSKHRTKHKSNLTKRRRRSKKYSKIKI